MEPGKSQFSLEVIESAIEFLKSVISGRWQEKGWAVFFRSTSIWLQSCWGIYMIGIENELF